MDQKNDVKGSLWHRIFSFFRSGDKIVPEKDLENDEFETPEFIELPTSDTLDLHHFNPKDVNGLINDWIEEVFKIGITEVRIIHGRGKGVLRNRTHVILSRHRLVKSFNMEPGNPGASIAVLVKPES